MRQAKANRGSAAGVAAGNNRVTESDVGSRDGGSRGGAESLRSPALPRRGALAAVLLSSVILVPPARGQYRIGPVYPETAEPAVVRNSGYDPFVFDSRSGRFRYVPIPYEPELRPGQGYSPYRLNWHSGRWDYVPVPLEQDVERWEAEDRMRAAQDRGGLASNYVDTRVTSQRDLSQRAQIAAGREGPTQGDARDVTPRPIPPTRMRPTRAESAPATTQAATRPAETPAGKPKLAPADRPVSEKLAKSRPPVQGESLGGGWVEVNGMVGRWEYNDLTGRWVFVLAPEGRE